MKNLILVLGLVLGAQAWAGIFNYGDYVDGEQQICLRDQGKVRCWSIDPKFSRYQEQQTPELRDPKFIAINRHMTTSRYDDMVCAIDLDGLKCWETINAAGTFSTPSLKNPRFVSIWQSRACAVDDEGVTCWIFNNDKTIEIEEKITTELKNPKMVSISTCDVCVLDDEGVKCWWTYGDRKRDKEPTLISIGKATALVSLAAGHCALLEAEVKCFSSLDNYSNPPYTFFSDLKNPKILSLSSKIRDGDSLDRPASNFYPCVLDDEGVKCLAKDNGYHYTQLYKVDSIKNPHALSGNCVLDAGVRKCWERSGSFYTGVYNYPLTKNKEKIFDYRIEDFLEKYLEVSTPARALYLQSLKPYFKNKNNWFLLRLVSPAITSMDSSFSIKELSFFSRDTETLGKLLGFQDLETAFMSYEDNIEGRQMTLKSIQAAVTVALEFVSIQEKAELQDLLRQIGQLMIDPSNTSQIKDLIVKLESLASPLQKLTSPKSAFLIDVINLAKDWLKKVK